MALEVGALVETVKHLFGFSSAGKQVMMYRSDGQLVWVSMATLAALLDHGTLLGLADDDHTQYLLANGTRDLSSATAALFTIRATAASQAAGVALIARRGSADKEWDISSRGGVDAPNDRLAFYNPSTTTERLTLSDAGGLSLNSPVDPGAGIINAATGYRIGNVAASGNVLRGNGTNFVSSAIQADDLPSTYPDIQVFTGNGTWTKPTKAARVTVICIGGGGGGGSGRKGLLAVASSGGGGGGGGGISTASFDASVLGATETITVGAAGTGGAAQATNSTDGVDGVAGGTSSFGSHLRAGGGGLGTKGVSGGNSSGGVGGLGNFGVGGVGGAGVNSSSGAVGSNGGGYVAGVNGAAGGGGGGGDNVGTGQAGGNGGSVYDSNITGGAGGAANVSGSAPTDLPSTKPLGGAGGGGSGSLAASSGTGGKFGGGGGGGGIGIDTVGSSTAGASGGIGLVVVLTF